MQHENAQKPRSPNAQLKNLQHHPTSSFSDLVTAPPAFQKKNMNNLVNGKQGGFFIRYAVCFCTLNITARFPAT